MDTRKIFTIFLYTTILIATLHVNTAMPQTKGVRIIVTFPSLKYDVEQLLCVYDSVESIVPPGVDPHSYELTPRDMEKLISANIVVSTAHSSFEKKIREKIENGEIKARLIEIPYLPGINILINPATSQPNYHMPIYDPQNYIVFMEVLEKNLEEVNPACSEEYRSKLERIRERIEEIRVNIPKLNITALAATPLAQYAVNWLGINVKFLIVKEHNVPTTPQDIIAIEEAAQRGEIGTVLLVNGSIQANEKAREIAEKYGIPVIVIPSPLEARSIPENLLSILDQLEETKIRHNVGDGSISTNLNLSYIMGIAVIAIILLLVVLYRRKT